jgi:hypothetical protein
MHKPFVDLKQQGTGKGQHHMGSFGMKPGVPVFKLVTRSTHEEPGVLFQAPVMG